MDQRERFEAWCAREGYSPKARVAWSAWQAAEAAALERAAQVCDENAAKLEDCDITKAAACALKVTATQLRGLAAPVERGGDK